MRAIVSTLRKRRKDAARALRHRLAVWKSGVEYRRLRRLGGAYEGSRCFLLANGPSLARMDLGRLRSEHVFLVNAGVNALDQGLPRATFHMVTDNNRYRRFAQDFERIAIAHDIEHRFYPFRCRRIWADLPVKGRRPFFVLSNPQRFVDRGMVIDPRHGYSGGATVLISAAQLLLFLGFDEVYILGCDLDYGGTAKYFYALGARDEQHEADPSVIARRNDMVLANRQFEIVRDFYQAQGRVIRNAGLGGNLDSLERVAFESLF